MVAYYVINSFISELCALHSFFSILYFLSFLHTAISFIIVTVYCMLVASFLFGVKIHHIMIVAEFCYVFACFIRVTDFVCHVKGRTYAEGVPK